jgi:hypothetical protein
MVEALMMDQINLKKRNHMKKKFILQYHKELDTNSQDGILLH